MRRPLILFVFVYSTALKLIECKQPNIVVIVADGKYIVPRGALILNISTKGNLWQFYYSRLPNNCRVWNNRIGWMFPIKFINVGCGIVVLSGNF